MSRRVCKFPYIFIFMYITYICVCIKGMNRFITVLIRCPALSISVKDFHLTAIGLLTLRLDLDLVITVYICSILTYSK